MKGQLLCAPVIYFWSITGAYSFSWENSDNSIRLQSTGFCQPFEEHSTEGSTYSPESEEYEETVYYVATPPPSYELTTSRIGDQIICHEVYLGEMNPIVNCINCKKLSYQESQILKIKTNLETEPNFIEELDMARTGIQKIESGAFANLPHLKVLNLEMNHLKKIRTGTFNSLRNLISLNLSHNAIEEIEDESFHGSVAISILDLSHNNISVLPDELFLQLNLLSLDISNNLLVNLGNTFCVSSNLITLRLDNNLLESIPICLRGSMITDLSVSFNSITDFEGDSLPLTLEAFDISNNNLRRIDVDSFFAYSYLEKVDLSANALETFETNSFEYLHNLKSLTINGMNIKTINSELFTSMETLTELRMAKNNISVIEKGIFLDLSNLELLDLSENNISSIPLELFMNLKSLQILNISHNNIKYLQPGVFNGMTKLKNLDLSFNYIYALHYYIFEPLTELNVLDIKFNHMKELNTFELAAFCRKLKLLAIDGNNFSCIALATISTQPRFRTYTLEKGRTFSSPNIGGISCHDSEERNGETNNNGGNKTSLKSFLDYDFQKTSFYNFFKNFTNREPHYNTDENINNGSEFLFKKITDGLSKDLNMHVKELMSFENTTFKNFLKELSAITARLNFDKNQNLSLSDVSSLRNEIEKIITFENSSLSNYMDKISDAFAKLENNQKNSDLMTVLIKNQQKNNAESLVQSDEAKRTECLINAIYQLKIFVILCTFIVLLTIFAMKISRRVKSKYSSVNSKEQNYEIPIIS